MTNETTPLLGGGHDPPRPFLAQIRTLFGGSRRDDDRTANKHSRDGEDADRLRPPLATDDSVGDLSSPVLVTPAISAELVSHDDGDSRRRRRLWLAVFGVSTLFLILAVVLFATLAIPFYIEALVNRDGDPQAGILGAIRIESFDESGINVSVRNLTLPAGTASVPLDTFIEPVKFDVYGCPDLNEGDNSTDIPDCSPGNRTHLYFLDLPRLQVPAGTTSDPLSFTTKISGIAEGLSGRFKRILALKDAAPLTYSRVVGDPTVGVRLLGIPLRWAIHAEKMVAFDTAELFRNVSKYAAAYQLIAHNGTHGSLPFPSEVPIEFLVSVSFMNPYPFGLRRQPFGFSAQIYTNESFPGDFLGTLSLPIPKLVMGYNERNISFTTNAEQHDKLLGLAAKVFLHVPVSLAVRNVTVQGENVPQWLQRVVGTMDTVIDLRDVVVL